MITLDRSKEVNVHSYSTCKEFYRKFRVCFGPHPMDEMTRITFADLYRVLHEGPPGDYLLMDA